MNTIQLYAGMFANYFGGTAHKGGGEKFINDAGQEQFGFYEEVRVCAPIIPESEIAKSDALLLCALGHSVLRFDAENGEIPADVEKWLKSTLGNRPAQRELMRVAERMTCEIAEGRNPINAVRHGQRIANAEIVEI